MSTWILYYKRLVIIGVGNTLRHDDNVGIEVVRRLKKTLVRDTILLIESESIPENFIEPIVRFNPSHILIIDAALLGLEPGTVKLSNFSEVTTVSISTHTLPIQLFCSYLSKVTTSKIGLLLIQPKRVSFGVGLSPKINKVVERIVEQLLKNLEEN